MTLLLGFLTFLYALLSAGGCMKHQHKAVFDTPFSHEKECAILHDLVNKITEGTSAVGVMLASQLAHSLIDRPSTKTFDLLVDLNPGTEYDARDFYRLRQIQALFSKREEIPGIKVDRRQAALEKFLESEWKCYETNKVLRSAEGRKDRAALFLQMQRKISAILGPCPDVAELPFAFGPGSNVGCSKKTSVRNKLMADATATEAAARLFIPVADQFHAWPGLKRLRLISGSNWTSVPKSFKTDRGINVEPLLNSFIQKGIGAVMRQRLARAGVNLDDQQPNQLLAQLGSTMHESEHGLATIDLSMASDLISYQLVLDLLPWDWFCLLDAARSPTVTLPDKRKFVLEKFSAMGNAYTFELESLIFYALLSAVCGDHSVISVYGDDLICPVAKYDQVLDALTLIGAIPNARKSFATGAFRESCGKDFWHGTNVRACYVKRSLSIQEIYRLHNYFHRTGWIDPSFLVDYLPSSARNFGPDGYGDGHMIGNFQRKRDKRGWEPFCVFKTYQAIPRADYRPLESDFGALLYSIKGSDDPDKSRSLTSDTMWYERSLKPRYKLSTVRVQCGHL